MNREFRINPTGIIQTHPAGCMCEFSVREFTDKETSGYRVFWRVIHSQTWSLVNEIVKKKIDGNWRWVQNDRKLITSPEIDEFGKAIDYCLHYYATHP